MCPFYLDLLTFYWKLRQVIRRSVHVSTYIQFYTRSRYFCRTRFWSSSCQLSSMKLMWPPVQEQAWHADEN